MGRLVQQGARSATGLRNLATPANPPSPNDPFANGTNAYYAEEMYRHWKQDPESVHASWNVYFSGLEKGLPSAQAFTPPPSVLPPPADGAPALHTGGGAELDDHLKVRFPVYFSPRQGLTVVCFRLNSWYELTKCAATMLQNSTPENSFKMASMGLRMTFARTLRRPR